jgi:branched-chain amino acid transport system substrate-binding protein
MLARKRIVFAVALLVVVAITLSGCAQKEAEPAVIKIGAALALTGNLAAEGKLTQEGYDLTIEKVNSKGGVKVGDKMYKLEIVYYDDESDAQRSAKLVDRLITEDGIKLILGPYSSGITAGSSVISEKNQAIMIATQATSNALYDRDFKYFFGTMGLGSTTVQVGINAVMAQTPTPKTCALLAADSLFPLSNAEEDRKYAAKVGLDIVYDTKFPGDVTDLAPVLSQVKALDPDILQIHGFFAHSVLVVKQLKELGWAPKALIMDVGPTMPDFVNSLGKDAEYSSSSQFWGLTTLYDDPLFGNTSQYIEEFEAKYGKPPDYHNVSASIGAEVFALAIEQAGSLDIDKIRDVIAAMDFETIYGPLKFGQGGGNIGVPGIFLQVLNGQSVVVYPSDQAGADFLYPLPAWDAR